MKNTHFIAPEFGSKSFRQHLHPAVFFFSDILDFSPSAESVESTVEFACSASFNLNASIIIAAFAQIDNLFIFIWAWNLIELLLSNYRSFLLIVDFHIYR